VLKKLFDAADIVREAMLHHLSRAVNRPNLNAEAEQQRGESSNKVLQTLRLGLILVLVVAPSSVLWLSAGASQPLTRVPPLWWGAWAIIALWVIFAKGLPALMNQGKDILGPIWVLLGITNLAAAILCLSRL
jgi:hypothetical protein